ncbi:MAG: O-antigen ligase family protein [Planctomycetaceae bacterium]
MTAQGSGSNPSTDLARHQSLWGKALQWTLIALLVSTAFLTGDGPAVAQGMSSWLIMCYLLVGCAWGIYQWLFPTVGFYRQWPTFLFSLAVVLMLISVFKNLEGGDFRASLNSWWLWVALAVGFTLILQLCRTQRLARGVVAVMTAVAVSISCIGIYDSLVRIPVFRGEYFSASAQERIEILQMAGISDVRVGAPGRYHFESRIQSPEPHVTFALTNSLAGFLAPWFTLMLLTLLNPGRKVSVNHVRLKLLVCIGLIAFCLILTKSRSACCAVVLSLLSAGLWLKSYRSVVLRAGLVLGVIGGFVFVLGLVTHRLDTKIVTEALKSLSFRMEYWESSMSMAWDNLWTGVGPGNFRDNYTLYKQAAASESIADPHNWPLEVLTSFGLPVLLLMVSVFVAGFRQYHVLAQANPEIEEKFTRRRTILIPDLSLNQVYLAGGFGCLIGLLVDQLTYALIPLFVFYVVLPAFAIVIFLLQDWIERGELNRHHLMVAFVCWLLNLMVAGGISYPGVAFTGWILLGLALRVNLPTESPSAQVLVSKTQRRTKLIIMAGLLLLAYFTTHRPVTLSERHLLNARFQLSQNQTTNALEHLRDAIDADPYGTEAYIQYANILFMQMRKNIDAQLWEQYQTLVSQALALNAKSQAAYELFSQQALLLYLEHQQPEVLRKAMEYSMRQTELYPESAYLWARLAIFQYYTGQLSEMNVSIENALRLDKDNPHLEFKLSNRRFSESEFAGWKGRQIYFEKAGESIEQSLQYVRNRTKQQ